MRDAISPIPSFVIIIIILKACNFDRGANFTFDVRGIEKCKNKRKNNNKFYFI